MRGTRRGKGANIGKNESPKRAARSSEGRAGRCGVARRRGHAKGATLVKGLAEDGEGGGMRSDVDGRARFRARER